MNPSRLLRDRRRGSAKYLRNVGQLFSIGKAHGAQDALGLGADHRQHRAAATSTCSWSATSSSRTAGSHHVFYIDSDTTLDPRGVFHAYLRIRADSSPRSHERRDPPRAEPGAAILANAVMVDIEKDLDVYAARSRASLPDMRVSEPAGRVSARSSQVEA